MCGAFNCLALLHCRLKPHSASPHVTSMGHPGADLVGELGLPLASDPDVVACLADRLGSDGSDVLHFGSEENATRGDVLWRKIHQALRQSKSKADMMLQIRDYLMRFCEVTGTAMGAAPGDSV